MLRRLMFAAGAALTLAAGLTSQPSAGVVNPDISVIGQPVARWTDAAGDAARKRVTLTPGETEFVFDAYLNPYARGALVLALAEGGIELEEGYFNLFRGLPAKLSLKGGKYRAGFGKLNPAHPHTYPFAERFRVLAEYLPGEEALNETGIQLSELVPLSGDAALTVSADYLEGKTFRITREANPADVNDPINLDAAVGDRQDEPRPAGLGRLSVFVPIDDRSGLELGASGTQGTNNVAAGTRTTVVGGDAKAKLWRGDRAYLLLQAEVLRLDREKAGWDETALAYTKTNVKPVGGYLFADYNWNLRYNAGASYERWQQPTIDKTWDQAVGLFAGLALMEETTAFRVSWDRYQPGRPPGATADPEALNTFTLRVIYSMGPHKAHQF